MTYIIRTAFIFCLLSLITSCSVTMDIKPEALTPAEYTSRIPQNSKSLKSIAVLNFTTSERLENNEMFGGLKLNVNLANDNKISTDITEKELFKYIDVIDRQTIDKVLNELNLQQSSAFDSSSAVEIGKLIGCSAVITGNVNYAYANLRRQTKGASYIATYLGNVSISMRLIDVQTGKILWISSISRNSQNYLSEEIKITNYDFIKNPDFFASYMHGSTPEQIIKYLMGEAIKESIKDLSKHL
jgi:PBP1b-binding outer membrane lipoprotein LpoB